MNNEIKRNFEISYEADGSSEYIIMKMKESKQILDYQVEMIANNPVNWIIPIISDRKNNETALRYKITSRYSLEKFLKDRKLEFNEIIQILRSVLRAILNSKNYLLSDKQFLVDEQFIYINPRTSEVSLVYIPIALEYDFKTNLKDFITNFLKKAIKTEAGENKQNLLGSIDNYLKNETFNLTDLYKFLGEIRDGDTENNHEESCKNQNREVNKKEISISSKISIPHEIYLNQPIKASYKTNILIAAGLMQALLAIIIYMGYRGIMSTQNADVSSLIGLIIIAAAVDFMVLRKVFNKENLKTIDSFTSSPTEDRNAIR